MNYPTHSESRTIKCPRICCMNEVFGKISGVRRQNQSARKKWEKESWVLFSLEISGVSRNLKPLSVFYFSCIYWYMLTAGNNFHALSKSSAVYSFTYNIPVSCSKERLAAMLERVDQDVRSNICNNLTVVQKKCLFCKWFLFLEPKMFVKELH